jgi:membrane protein DedA with SNARE-associated domain
MYVINLLVSKWYIALIVGGSLEGLSLPFPSQPLVLYIGHLVNLKEINFALAGAIFALPYTVASCVPYLIGLKYGKMIGNVSPRYMWYLSKGKGVFNKYGDISVLITRPFAIGNYVSYLAGIYRMNIIKYLSFTFLGIFFWATTFLYLGAQLAFKFNMLMSLIFDNINESILVFFVFCSLAGIVFLLARKIARSR